MVASPAGKSGRNVASELVRVVSSAASEESVVSTVSLRKRRGLVLDSFWGITFVLSTALAEVSLRDNAHNNAITAKRQVRARIMQANGVQAVGLLCVRADFALPLNLEAALAWLLDCPLPLRLDVLSNRFEF